MFFLVSLIESIVSVDVGVLVLSSIELAKACRVSTVKVTNCTLNR